MASNPPADAPIATICSSLFFFIEVAGVVFGMLFFFSHEALFNSRIQLQNTGSFLLLCQNEGKCYCSYRVEYDELFCQDKYGPFFINAAFRNRYFTKIKPGCVVAKVAY